MLTITVPAGEQWDELKQEFVYTKECKREEEHTPVSQYKKE